jgi:hypothetical protein
MTIDEHVGQNDGWGWLARNPFAGLEIPDRQTG